MNLSFGLLWDVTKLTIQQPRLAAEQIRAAGIGRDAAWTMMVLSAVASALISGVSQVLMPPPEGPVEIMGVMVEIEPTSPFMMGVFSFLAAAGIAFALYAVGQRRGGQGSFGTILSLMAVLQMVLVVLQAISFLLSFTLPLAALIFILFQVFIFFRALGHFTMVGHEFTEPGQATLTIILSFLLLFVGFVFLSPVFGLVPTPA